MKISIQVFTIFFAFLLGLSNVAAKEISIVQGQVKDQKGEALPFANVMLVDAQSESMIGDALLDVSQVSYMMRMQHTTLSYPKASKQN